MASPPSIPSHDSVFGYEEADNGRVIKQKNPINNFSGNHLDLSFLGVNSDTVGPGQYDIDRGVNKLHINRGNGFKMSSVERKSYFDKSIDSEVGPGYYLIENEFKRGKKIIMKF